MEMLNARLSVLRGPTHITPHCGMSNAKLRVHVGLRVPAAADGGRGEGEELAKSGLRVGSEVREWVEGEALVFDDSFEHEVWWRHSESDPVSGTKATEEDTVEDESERVVLIVDVGAQAISAALLVVASHVLRDYM